MIKDISRAAVDGYLKVVRKPIDAVISRGSTERASALGVKVDRADAAARGIAGSALRDPSLQEDARHRRAAADERENALRLRSVAEQRSETAQLQAEEAEQQAESKKKQAEQRKKAKKQTAAQRSSTRKQSAQKTAAAKKAEADKQAKRDKLAQLEAKEKALEEKEEAVNAAAESRRLADAAGAAKAERKKD